MRTCESVQGSRRAKARALSLRLQRSNLGRRAQWLRLAAADARDGAMNRRDPLEPPRRLRLGAGPGDFAEQGERWLGILTETGGLEPDGRVLDIGCGPGRLAAGLTGHLDHGSYEGFDVIPKAVRWCQQAITPRHPQFRFQVADVHNRRYHPAGSQRAVEYAFPFPDADFDVAFAASVFTHMVPAETERYLCEAGRVLRPGGRLMATFFLLNEESERFLTITSELSHETADEQGRRYRSSRAEIPEHRVATSEADVGEMYAGAGLEIEEVRYGRWAGRPARRLRQDLIVATKA